MSVIIAYKSGDSVWVGSDTLGTIAGRHVNVGKKWFRHGRWFIGTTGESRQLDIIRRASTLEPAATVEDLADAIAALFEGHGYRREPDPRTGCPCFDIGFVVVDCDELRLYEIAGSMAVVEWGDRVADGHGGDYALGALCMAEPALPPGLAVNAALEIACGIDMYCGLPLFVEEVVR